MLEPSAWRAGDAVRFGAAREALNQSTAMLFELVDRGELELGVAATAARDLRAEFWQIDGFDRGAVDHFVTDLDARVATFVGVDT